MVGKNILNHKNSVKHDFLIPSRKELDLLDYSAISSFLKKNNPILIIHAAGLVGGIEANIKKPVKFLTDNTNIGLNLINAANNNNVNYFLNLGSSCMYPRFAKNPLNENLILKGELEPTNEGYALAKIISTRLCEYICKENTSRKYKTIIPCNLYGKFDNFKSDSSHMIPAAITKIHNAYVTNKETVNIWGDGLSRREFMVGSSFADLIFYAINNFENIPQNMNVGLGNDFSINEYYKIIAKVIGFQGKFTNDLSKPTGMKQKLVDIKTLSKFGWSNKVSLEDGIIETYKYYLKHHAV